MAMNLPSFEKAEYGAGLRDHGRDSSVELCASCQQPLTGEFYRLNGKPMCEPCANGAVRAPAEGTTRAFAQAVVFGLVAAIVGSVVYAAVEIGTGWTIGYVALAVGWMVGKGMKLGSRGRGGRRYQITAALLTYCSVSMASMAVIVHAIQKQNPDVHLVANEKLIASLLRYGLLSPFLELRHGLGGIVGLFILFIGIQAAWTLTAGSDFRVTGPHTSSNDVMMQP